jgi:hypothetical protein
MKYFMYYCPACAWSHHGFDQVMYPQCPECGQEHRLCFAKTDDYEEMVGFCTSVGVDPSLIRPAHDTVYTDPKQGEIRRIENDRT